MRARGAVRVVAVAVASAVDVVVASVLCVARGVVRVFVDVVVVVHAVDSFYVLLELLLMSSLLL